MQPLAGVRVLSMEQAAALPFMSRRLADLGAEVIRVQSHKRRVAGSQYLGNFRNKQLLGLDLATPEGPALFRQLAAKCDIVAHNYTSRVMDKYGLDFESIRQVQPRVIYCALTGYGSTGPWRATPAAGSAAVLRNWISNYYWRPFGVEARIQRLCHLPSELIMKRSFETLPG